MARALGVGGVFFKSEDPERLMAWYGEVFGLTVDGPSPQTGGWGVSFELDDLPSDLYLRFAIEAPDTRHFDRAAMVNFVVDDLDGVLAQVEQGGGTVLLQMPLDGVGRFAWFDDPEGNRVELWEPVDSPARN